jgi:DNA-binding transcriptional MerR regulator
VAYVEYDLISKKDLLLQTGISYGQLYRWKRKGLIPEEWFVRKSTFTGQETFFPRDRMLERVARIRDMKDEDLSLEDIADTLSPAMVADVSLRPDEVRQRALVSDAALDLFLERRPGADPLLFGELLAVAVLDRLLQAGDISLDEGRSLVETMSAGVLATQGRDYELVLVRKLGLSAWLLKPIGCEIILEPSARAVVRLGMGEVAEQLKQALK